MYPPDHDFIFLDLKKYFLSTFLWIRLKLKQTCYTYLNTCWRTVKCSYSIGPHVDAVGPALGWQSVLQVYPPCPDYKTPISGDCFDLTAQNVNAASFDYMYPFFYNFLPVSIPYDIVLQGVNNFSIMKSIMFVVYVHCDFIHDSKVTSSVSATLLLSSQ